MPTVSARATDESRTVTYTVDLDGVITRVDGGSWERFALDNGAPSLADPANVVGKRLEDFVVGPAKDHIRILVRMLRQGQYPDLGYAFRCDAPHKDRLMRMSMHVLTGADGAVSGLEFASTVIREEELLESVLLYHDDPGEDAPFLRMCSYCKRVDHDGDWMLPRDYERTGASTRVRLSHVICPACERDVVEPMLQQFDREARQD